MKRQTWILVAGLALGLAGCAVGTEEPIDEGTGEQAAELGADTGPGTQGTTGGPGSLGRPGDLVTTSSGDPSGPTPYPWTESDDPSGGPTPYPWDDNADQTDHTKDNTQPNGGSTAGTGTSKTTSTSH
ncbi:MAG: hypothetical protein AMXMBFR56_50610 [Polyangiaceae bacterium]